MSESRTLTAIELEIAEHKVALSRLCEEAVHVLAENNASGNEALRWLIDAGMQEIDARNLCVEIIRKRRAARDANA